MSTFTCFSDLPSEMRLKIWVFALLEAEPRASGHPRIVDMVGSNRKPVRGIKTPCLVLACRETKAEWDRILKRFPFFCSCLPKSRCNLGADTLRWAQQVLDRPFEFPRQDEGPFFGLCRDHCSGRQLVERIIVQPISSAYDILGPEVTTRRVTNSLGSLISMWRTWDVTDVEFLPLDTLGLTQLRDIWFEGQDPFGLEFETRGRMQYLDVATFMVDGASLVTYPSYLFRYWIKTHKAEVALLSQAVAKKEAAGQFWEHRGRNFEFGDAADGTICRIRVIHGDADDGDDESVQWKEILPKVAGEPHAMNWHRVVWNGIVNQIWGWLVESHNPDDHDSEDSGSDSEDGEAGLVDLGQADETTQ